MLKRIISGGQVGADQAALDAAIKYNHPHGGWIQKGSKTQMGTLPDNYNLKEMSVSGYKERIEQNVTAPDGTIIISHVNLSGGADYSQKMAELHSQPCLIIDLNETSPFISFSKINTWIIENNIRTMNVTGSRASEDSDIYKDTYLIIENTISLNLLHAKSGEQLTDYDRKKLLDKLPLPPETVDEAVEKMISDLDLESKFKIANMDLNNLASVNFELHVYFKNAFDVWHGNKELLADCRATSGEPICNEEEATFVILKALWEKLRGTHTLRVVK